jgi:hypothetical protein
VSASATRFGDRRRAYDSQQIDEEFSNIRTVLVPKEIARKLFYEDLRVRLAKNQQNPLTSQLVRTRFPSNPVVIRSVATNLKLQS